MDASDILPIEIWTKILQDLSVSQLIIVQDVCLLFWNIIQDFVALGQIKSDFYVSEIWIFAPKPNIKLV